MRRRVGSSSLMLTVALAAGCGSNGHTEPGYRSLSGSGGAGGEHPGTSSMQATASSSAASGGAGPAAKGPPYPVVLAHGFFGFEEFAGLDFATYYYEVQDHLAAHGEHYIFTPPVDPFNSSEVRGAQLAAAIETILDSTGHAKVNIIGHSQGGLDARVVAHDHPDWVASVITLQTPHGGTPISDIAMKVVDDPDMQDVLDWIVQALGMPLYDEVGEETSVWAAVDQFSSPAIAEFNASYPDQPGIYYASIAGRSDHHGGGSHCNAPTSPAFLAAWNAETDPIDPLFSVTEAIIDGGWGDPYPNDGLVRVVDAKRGEFLGCLPADHLDMVGHLFGDQPGGGNDWNHLQFYLDLIALIRHRGL